MVERSATRKAKTKPKSQPADPPVLRSVNPATGELVAEIPCNSPEEVREIVAQARKVAPEWAGIPVQGRVRMLKEVRHRIYERLDDIIRTVSLECGKPNAEALITDAIPAILYSTYFERVASRALRSQKVGRVISPVALGFSSRIDWRPFGVVGCISPWNYPFNLSFLGMVPALVAGNTVVLKPSEFTPSVGELVREVFDPLPPGVVSVVQGGGDVGAALVDAPCDKLCFIGSPATGKKIAAAAAKHLTPIVMELGGKDPTIVCADADLDTASSGVVWGSFVNSGQTCCAIERAYVVDSVADEFTERLLDKVHRIRQGSDGDVGPLTTPAQLDIVSRHVDDAAERGARILAGGPEEGRERENGSLWYAPTVVDNINEEMELASGETFGPVLPIIRVRDEDEAVRRANEQGFSLTASVWTRDRKKAERLAGRLRAGSIAINDHASTIGAPWGPWGGVGESGYGRLNGILALREFSVPVHVARNVTPQLKRMWWYPYDGATTETLRAAAQLLTAPKVTEKARAAGTLLSGIAKTIKGKL